MKEKANTLLEIIFSQPICRSNHDVLMGLFDTICELEEPLMTYLKFFTNRELDLEQTTKFNYFYSTKLWGYQIIPAVGGKEQ